MSLRSQPRAIRLIILGALPAVTSLAVYHVTVEPSGAELIYGAVVAVILGMLAGAWAYERERRKIVTRWMEGEFATVHRVLGAHEKQLRDVRHDVNSKLITREWHQAFARAEAAGGRPHLWVARGGKELG